MKNEVGWLFLIINAFLGFVLLCVLNIKKKKKYTLNFFILGED